MKHDFSELRLEAVTRRFAGAGGKAFNALSELTMTIKRGEFIALLGPSGCGKSTALNCIAGLLQLSGGSIKLDDLRIDVLPPEQRGFGMVFQNYALFPHMSVEKNVGFGLRMRGVSASDTAPRVAKALRMVQLTGQEHKLPGQLSGGQQQRRRDCARDRHRAAVDPDGRAAVEPRCEAAASRRAPRSGASTSSSGGRRFTWDARPGRGGAPARRPHRRGDEGRRGTADCAAG
jgi:ABC-type taurine transport system ATPase subunit